ncbi:anti-sigma regulatory factor [Desulfobacula phenolica]|nr:anti-sigma regulatory factor [Desulfobacula phenolica]
MDETSAGLVFDVSIPSDNAQVVFIARHMLDQLGFDKTRQYLIASAVSELSTNIIRYGKKGIIILKKISNANQTGFEVTARDNGPGMPDIQKALKENYSTGNGLGLGLPSVRRIMDEFEIWSKPGQGTRIIARKWML